MRSARGFPNIRVDNILADGKIKNCFGACNLTLKQDIGERTFLYGGIGAGVVRAVVDVNFKDIGIELHGGGDWSSCRSEHDANGDFWGRYLVVSVGT